MERSEMRERHRQSAPDFASLHPGYLVACARRSRAFAHPTRSAPRARERPPGPNPRRPPAGTAERSDTRGCRHGLATSASREYAAAAPILACRAHRRDARRWCRRCTRSSCEKSAAVSAKSPSKLPTCSTSPRVASAHANRHGTNASVAGHTVDRRSFLRWRTNVPATKLNHTIRMTVTLSPMP